MQTLEQVLFWCMVANLALLVLSVILVAGFKPMVLRLHAKMFGVPEDFVARALYVFLGAYKMVTFFFVVIPWIALKVVL